MSEIACSRPSWWKIAMRCRSILTANGARATSSASVPRRCRDAMENPDEVDTGNVRTVESFVESGPAAGGAGLGGNGQARPDRAEAAPWWCARFLQRGFRTRKKLTSTPRLGATPERRLAAPQRATLASDAAPPVSGGAGGVHAAGRARVHALGRGGDAPDLGAGGGRSYQQRLQTCAPDRGPPG